MGLKVYFMRPKGMDISGVRKGVRFFFSVDSLKKGVVAAIARSGGRLPCDTGGTREAFWDHRFPLDDRFGQHASTPSLVADDPT